MVKCSIAFGSMNLSFCFSLLIKVSGTSGWSSNFNPMDWNGFLLGELFSETRSRSVPTMLFKFSANILFLHSLLAWANPAFSWVSSHSSLSGKSFETNWSKFGSGLKDLLETSFFLQVGHSLFPDLSAVMMHSAQNLCKHSFVVMVVFNKSRQIGHLRSEWTDFEETAILVEAVVIKLWAFLLIS